MRIAKLKTYDTFLIRLRILMGVCLVMALVILGRAFQFQIIGDQRLARLSKQQFQSRVLIQPTRGLIVDRNGENLAGSLEIQSLAADPKKIENPDKHIWGLSKALGLPYGEVAKKLKSNRDFVWIKRHLPADAKEQMKRFNVLSKTGSLPEGLWLVRESERVYPHNEVGAHIIGDVNVDMEGIEGVELWYNEHMRGKMGAVNAIRDALGRPAFVEGGSEKKVEDGKPVQLTIDIALQFAVERALKAAVEKHKADGGSVIVMDADTGEILAMANNPTLNAQRAGPLSARRNRAITDGLEPGSTMKPILMAAALEKGWTTKKLIWAEEGRYKIQGRWITEAESHEKFKWLNLKQMIQVSSNVGAAKVALDVGPALWSKTLKKFGFGAKTGTGFPGEISGIVPGAEKMKPLTLATMGFGQGMLVTPIQMARAYAVFANGGLLVEPTLIKQPESNSRRAPVQILNSKIVEGVRDALLMTTVPPGTATAAAVPGFEIAGKTGTAQVVDPRTRKYSASHYVASFAGFAVGIEPRIVIYTLIDHPRGVYYASETAAPLFKEIFLATIHRLGIDSMTMTTAKSVPARQGTVSAVERLASLPAPAPVLESVPPPAVTAATEPDDAGKPIAPLWKMPSFVGLSAREVLDTLKGRNFHVQMRGFGLARAQRPAAGSTIKEGETLWIEFSEAPTHNEVAQ